MSSSFVWNNLATYSLQIGLLIGLAALAPTILRLRAPGAKLAYWHLLLATCLLLPLVRPWRQQMVTGDISISTTILSEAPARPAQRAIPVTGIALLLLAAGAVARLGWLGAGFRRLNRYRRQSQPIQVDWPWKSKAELRLSSEVSSPVTFGVRHPVVLLPPKFPLLAPPIQHAILCHELLHVDRKDWLFTLAEEVVRAIFWFHPAIWWLLGEIQLAREQAVDQQVIDLTQARDEYVDALLAIAGGAAQPDLAPAPLFLRRRHLKQRVISIFKEVRMSKTKVVSALAAGLGILAAACWFITTTFPLAAAPQVVNDAAGVSVDTGGAVLLHRAPVLYPEAARQKGVSGNVILDLTLDGSGAVSDARVVSGPEELRRAALQSALQWHFTRESAGGTRQVTIAFHATAGPAALEKRPYQVQGSGDPAARDQQLRELTNRLQEVEKQTSDSADRQKQLAELRARAAMLQAARAREEAAANWRGTLKSVNIMGLPEAARSELLSRLPVREGGSLNNESLLKMQEVVREFDEHLSFSISRSDDGATVRIVAPSATMTSDAPQRIRVGGNVQQVMLISQPRPVYPPEAKAARVQGTVSMQAVISKDGTVADLQVLQGHPMLVPAALDAVKQWVYKPTLLNGQPVEVVTQIDVNFTLSQ